jgi:hypothetical protein
MCPVAHGIYGGFGGADEAANLRVGEIGLVPQHPGDGIGFVGALRDWRISRAFRAYNRLGYVGFGEFKTCSWVGFATVDFFAGQLPSGDGVLTDNANCDFAIGYGLHLQFMESAKLSDLQETQRSVVDQPYSRAFWHEQFRHYRSFYRKFL